jgi:hypothetical protein
MISDHNIYDVSEIILKKTLKYFKGNSNYLKLAENNLKYKSTLFPPSRKRWCTSSCINVS